MNRSILNFLLFLAAMIITGSLLFGISGCSKDQEPAPAAQTVKAESKSLPPVPENLPMAVDFDNVPLSEVVQFVTSQTGKGVVLSGSETMPITWIESNLTKETLFTSLPIRCRGFGLCSWNRSTIRARSMLSRNRKSRRRRCSWTMPGLAVVCFSCLVQLFSHWRSSRTRFGMTLVTGMPCSLRVLLLHFPSRNLPRSVISRIDQCFLYHPSPVSISNTVEKETCYPVSLLWKLSLRGYRLLVVSNAMTAGKTVSTMMETRMFLMVTGINFIEKWSLLIHKRNQSFADFPRSFSRAAVQQHPNTTATRRSECRAAVSLLFRVNDAGSCWGLLNGKRGKLPSIASGPFFVLKKATNGQAKSMRESPEGMTKSYYAGVGENENKKPSLSIEG